MQYEIGIKKLMPSHFTKNSPTLFPGRMSEPTSGLETECDYHN